MAKINPVSIKKTKYGTYALHYVNPDGRRRRLSVGKDYQHAQRLAVVFFDWLLAGKDPEHELERTKQAEKTKSITIQELFPIFMERHGSLQSKSMQDIYKNSFKNICRCSQIAEAPICSISKGLMLNYMSVRMKNEGVTPATVNREASFMRSMLSRAVDWEILESNPLSGLRLLREAGKRKVNIDPEQIASLINELREPVASITELAVYSGFRKENILSLKIEQISFHDMTESGEVELKVKGGKTEVFPIGLQAVSLLKRVIGGRKEGFVFINSRTGTRYNFIHKQFTRAVNKLGLKVGNTKFRFHDLRHVFATWLHSKGVSLDVLRPLLGHSNRSTTDRYTTVDRLACGNVLNLMPEIKRKEKKKKASNG